MDNKIIKKFCKSKKNGILSKNKPEGILNYISFYKDIDSDDLKPHLITFKKSLNKKNRYNLCKDNSCREDEYVVKNLSMKKVKKLLKNIDDFNLANVRKQLNLENRVSSKIKFIKQTKKQKAKKFRQCRELIEKKVSKINSKKIQKKSSKASTKKISLDFFRRLVPKTEKPEQTEPPKVIIKEVIQTNTNKPDKKNNQELEKLRKEQTELIQKIKELEIKQQEQQQVQIQQEQQLPNNNSEKQKYLEKIKSLEKNLKEVASYGEKKSEEEKSLKQKIDKTKYEYERELQKQKHKLLEEAEKRRRLEYRSKYQNPSKASYNLQISQYKKELAKRKAQENRLRRERNQYRNRAAIAKPVVANNKPNPRNNTGNTGNNAETNTGNTGNNAETNTGNNEPTQRINKDKDLIIGAFDIFIVDFKTINNKDVNAIKSHIELLKQNQEKEVYLLNLPKELLDEESLKEYFLKNDYSTNNGNEEARSRLKRLRSNRNNIEENIEHLIYLKTNKKGKRTLLIFSNDNNQLNSIFHKKDSMNSVDGILLKNNIDDLFSIEKRTLNLNILSSGNFKTDSATYTYYDNDNSCLSYN